MVCMTATATPTTGGLETVFEKDTFLGLDLRPQAVLTLSVVWSLKSCIMLHMKTLKTAKGFFPFKTAFFVLLWGSVATLRRILAVVAFFIPSFGLFSILYHWQAEKIPFKMRLDYARKFGISPGDKIGLYGLTETVYWSELDRWSYRGAFNRSYEGAFNPRAPHYSLYTGMALNMSFVVFLAISTVQFLILWLVKNRTSEEFRKGGNYFDFDKFTHVLLNLNFAFPYKDWDCGKHSKDEYKRRFQRTKIEMLTSLLTNFVLSLVMLIPLFITGNI